MLFSICLVLLISLFWLCLALSVGIILPMFSPGYQFYFGYVFFFVVVVMFGSGNQFFFFGGGGYV